MFPAGKFVLRIPCLVGTLLVEEDPHSPAAVQFSKIGMNLAYLRAIIVLRSCDICH